MSLVHLDEDPELKQKIFDAVLVSGVGYALFCSTSLPVLDGFE